MSNEQPGYPYGPPVGGPPVPLQQNQSNTLSIVSFVMAAISVLFIPILFGIIAMVLAGVAISRGERLGRTAMIVAPICLVVGIVIGYVVFKSMYG